MRLSLPQKWFAGLMTLLAALLLAINLGINCFLPPYLIDEIKEDLKRNVTIIRYTFGSELAAKPPQTANLNAHAHELSKETGLRITVIAPDGTVIAESDKPIGELRVIENHLQRPEIQSALHTGLGYSTRYSDTVGTDMMYAAVTVPYEDAQGFVRVALPLHRITEFKDRVLHTVVLASLMVGLAAIPVIFWMARRTTRPILEMREVSRRVAGGELSSRATVPPGTELGDLSADLNHMAAQLEARLRELKNEKSELEAILTSMTDGVLEVDARGRIRLANNILQQQFQMGDEIRGKTVLEVFRNNVLDEIVTEAMRKGGTRSQELTIFGVGEQFFEVKAATLCGVDDNGAVVVFHDITRLKQLENLRKDFVANVSHELRTPLSIIKGYVETLLDPHPPDAETIKKFLQTIQKHSSRLETLIGDLLAISSMESQSAKLNFEAVALRATTEAVLTDLGPQIKVKETQVRLKIADSLPRLKADPQRLHQVLFNLLDNAIKYTQAKGQITVSAREANNEIECCVADNGPGIAAEHLPRIFERFYRVDKARSRELGGTGLGLAIVKHIVQAHGGRVWVESKPGEGSSFYFTLPKT